MALTPYIVWFLVGVVFLVAELALPGFVLTFFAAGAWFTALAVWLTDIDLTSQIVLFIVSSLVLLFTLRRISLRVFRGETVEDVDDEYARAKIGKTGVVTKAIEPNLAGEVKVMGSFWRAVAETAIEEGRPVKVVALASADGLTVKVEPA